MEHEYLILDKINTLATTYLAPKGYFDNLIVNILVKIKSNETVYSIPENYFENLNDSILNKIKTQVNFNEIVEELHTIAPLLNSINKENIYQTPKNYFEHLETKPTTKIGIVKKINFGYKWIKYAAAAIVSGIIATSVLYKGFDKNILAQHQISINTDIEESIINVGDNDLNTAIIASETTIVGVDETAFLPLQNTINLQDEIQFVSDEIIENYIKNNTPADNINLPTS